MNTKAGRGTGFFNIFFSLIFSLLLAASAVLLVLLLFVHGLDENTAAIAAGAAGGGSVLFSEAWYPVALGAVLVIMPFLILILINRHCIRRMFLAVGISALLSAALCIALALFRMRIWSMLSGGWQDMLLNATGTFRDFSVICATLLAAAGAACLSIYSCIAAVKGGCYEEVS